MGLKCLAADDDVKRGVKKVKYAMINDKLPRLKLITWLGNNRIRKGTLNTDQFRVGYWGSIVGPNRMGSNHDSMIVKVRSSDKWAAETGIKTMNRTERRNPKKKNEKWGGSKSPKEVVKILG